MVSEDERWNKSGCFSLESTECGNRKSASTYKVIEERNKLLLGRKSKTQ